MKGSRKFVTTFPRRSVLATDYCSFMGYGTYGTRDIAGRAEILSDLHDDEYPDFLCSG
jgi:hypothetical protein